MFASREDPVDCTPPRFGHLMIVPCRPTQRCGDLSSPALSAILRRQAVFAATEVNAGPRRGRLLMANRPLPWTKISKTVPASTLIDGVRITLASEHPVTQAT